jgi:predicted DsbA family dithiol-disulfide isomerase
VVEKLQAEQEVQVEWRPFYLRPDTPPEGSELPAYVRTRMAGAHERLKQMAQAAGMEMVFPTRIPNTRRAHEATEYARALGKHLEFHRVVFRLYYAEGQDISHWDILRAAALETGLDPDEMQREVEDGHYTQLVEDQMAVAQELGISGVPTYILDDKYAIVGAQPYEAFQRVVARLANEASQPHQES